MSPARADGVAMACTPPKLAQCVFMFRLVRPCVGAGVDRRRR